MAEDSKVAPIIVINKKIMHGGHHGGAWKVAFADFVTAMMALFIVLWLLNTSQDVKESVAGYFKDPAGNGRMAGSALAGSGDALQIKKEELSELKDKLQDAMKEVPEFKELEDQVQITVTGEGMRIELMETEKSMFFQSGKADPSEIGKDFLAKLASEIGQLNNFVTIEGHTDAKPFSSKKGYSNWELSADRANAARRLMEASGLKKNQVTQVRGFADQRLRTPDNPDDPSNRRISIIVQYDAKVREEDKSILQKQHEKDMKQKEGKGKGEGGAEKTEEKSGGKKDEKKQEIVAAPAKSEGHGEKGHEEKSKHGEAKQEGAKHEDAKHPEEGKHESAKKEDSKHPEAGKHEATKHEPAKKPDGKHPESSAKHEVANKKADEASSDEVPAEEPKPKPTKKKKKGH